MRNHCRKGSDLTRSTASISPSYITSHIYSKRASDIGSQEDDHIVWDQKQNLRRTCVFEFSPTFHQKYTPQYPFISPFVQFSLLEMLVDDSNVRAFRRVNSLSKLCDETVITSSSYKSKRPPLNA